MTKDKTRESKIETYLKTRIKKMGGLTFKFVSPEMAGVPDRIVLYNGRTYFVEVKRPGEKPRVLQVAMMKKIKKQGVYAGVASTTAEVDEFIEHIKTTVEVDAFIDYIKA